MANQNHPLAVLKFLEIYPANKMKTIATFSYSARTRRSSQQKYVQYVHGGSYSFRQQCQIVGETIKQPHPYDEFMDSSDKGHENPESTIDCINDYGAD